MWDKRKKFFFHGILTVICAAAFSACGTITVKEGATVMEINGRPVIKEEYQMILRDYEAQVKMQYTTEEVNKKDFWNTQFSDGRPVEKIIKLANEDLIEKKILLQLAEDAGIDAPLDYNAILEQMGQHNNESVYGLQEFEINSYYDYVFAGIENDVMNHLKKNYALTDQELQEVYEERKEEYTSDVSVDMLVVEVPKDTDETQVHEIAEAMRTETDVRILRENYPDAYFYNITLSTLDTQEGRTGIYVQRWQIASSMQEGEMCEPFFAGDSTLIMRCLSRKENVIEPLEEVRGELESQIRTQLAKEDIAREAESAKINYEEDVLEQVALEALEQ